MDTPGAKELLGMIKRLETLAKERIALAEAGTTVPVLDDAATETLKIIQSIAIKNGLNDPLEGREWLLSNSYSA